MKQTPHSKESAPQHSQRRFALLMLAILLLILGVTWLIRYPQGYVNILLGHYVGTTSVLDELDELKPTPAEEEILLPLEQEFDDWKQTHLADPLSLTASCDGTALKGSFYDMGGDVTVIGLHPFDSNAEGDFLYVPYYAARGYNIFLPDLRSHGESDGFLVTWGYYESRDLIDWMDALDQTYGSQTYVLHGQDLGANTALGAAGDPRVALITAESPILPIRDGLRYILTERFHFPGFLMPVVDWNANQLLPDDLTLNTLSLPEAKDSDTPLLLLSSGSTGLADPQAVKAFYQEYHGSKALIEDSDASQGMVYPRRQAEVEEELDRMLQQVLFP